MFWGTETDVAAFKPVKCESGERECYRRSRGTVSRWQQHSLGKLENKLIIQNLLSQQFDKLNLFNKTRSVEVLEKTVLAYEFAEKLTHSMLLSRNKNLKTCAIGSWRQRFIRACDDRDRFPGILCDQNRDRTESGGV